MNSFLFCGEVCEKFCWIKKGKPIAKIKIMYAQVFTFALKFNQKETYGIMNWVNIQIVIVF